MAETAASRRHLFHVALLLLPAAALRAAYVAMQPAHDPWYGAPIFDGAYYLDWAAALARGEAGPGGAFYRAPLYPYLVAGWIRLLGPAALPGGLFLLQQALSVATAGLIAAGWRARLGGAGALLAAGLFLLYPPLWFFASVPMGETLALFLLVLALWLVGQSPAAPAACAGLVAGAAILVRPNLLLVAAVWGAGLLLTRGWRRAVPFAAGVGLLLAPVALHNLRASGHLVPVSSNAGLTAFHGNGPGALGLFTAPHDFSATSDVLHQRSEATRLARQLSGRQLDDVEADRWWGAQARRIRREDPAGSARLLWNRLRLLLDNHEFTLDYPPGLDANPLQPALLLGPGRRLVLVPFALLLALALAGLVGRRGAAATGLSWTWLAILACAATPLLFYVSSRYRLPFAALLALPAGRGLAELLGLSPAAELRRRLAALALALLALLVSLVAVGSVRTLRDDDMARGLARRAKAYAERGELPAAEVDVRAALARAPNSATAWNQLGVILVAREQGDQAEAAFRSALEAQADFGAAAVNLSHLLSTAGRREEAIELLRGLLEQRPREAQARINLIVNLHLVGRFVEAHAALEQALALGVDVPAGLVEAIRSAPVEP